MFLRAAVLFLLLTVPALAHDMSDENGAWYRSLQVPGTGGFGIGGHSCCSGNEPDADCRNVETRQVKDPDGSIHVEAFSDSKLFPDSRRSEYYGHATDTWVRVPEFVVILGKNNPTGSAVGCWFDHKWRCFVFGTQA